MNQLNNDNQIAPLNRRLMPLAWEGQHQLKPWHYVTTVVIPHLETPGPLEVAVKLWRNQTTPPYILIIDTGSTELVKHRLEALRSHDTEIHYIRSHAWQSPSEPVTAALDLATTLLHTPYVIWTHADVFCMTPDVIDELLALTSSERPVVGYRMSPRAEYCDEWSLCVSHTLTMCHVDTLLHTGATWAMRRALLQKPEQQFLGGWPDTETAWNRTLREHAITPYFIGDEHNYDQFKDARIDHVRSFTGRMLYAPLDAEKSDWTMSKAMLEALDRLDNWTTSRLHSEKATPGEHVTQPKGRLQNGKRQGPLTQHGRVRHRRRHVHIQQVEGQELRARDCGTR